MIRVAVIGTGYVGLVTGACLADFGNQVRCLDVDEAKIMRLRAGEIPFFEPGLEELVERNQRARRLEFDTDLDAATAECDILFITVGTPSRKDGAADLSAIFQVGDQIAAAARGYKVVVQKSTAPVGTARRLQAAMRKRAGRRATIDVASNPEFLRE